MELITVCVIQSRAAVHCLGMTEECTCTMELIVCVCYTEQSSCTLPRNDQKMYIHYGAHSVCVCVCYTEHWLSVGV